jgi:hypothetical protein
MTLPGFNAEASSYKSSVHYRLMAALVQADGVIVQQLPLAGINRCGPCYTDDTGACVRECNNPNGGDPVVVPCPSSQCPAGCGPCICRTTYTCSRNCDGNTVPCKALPPF